jgi:hypothetical protein
MLRSEGESGCFKLNKVNNQTVVEFQEAEVNRLISESMFAIFNTIYGEEKQTKVHLLFGCRCFTQ